ncbi:MAG: hypothetical protein FWG65_10820 [Turicibacter sp.]|nr:hypothetical protein [Turicibacter sp.]
MNWESDLVKRAYLVMNSLACEVFFSKDMGKKVLLVTDCLDETQRAFFVKSQDNKFFTKYSTFRTARRVSDLNTLVTNNTRLLLERINEL